MFPKKYVWGPKPFRLFENKNCDQYLANWTFQLRYNSHTKKNWIRIRSSKMLKLLAHYEIKQKGTNWNRKLETEVKRQGCVREHQEQQEKMNQKGINARIAAGRRWRIRKVDVMGRNWRPISSFEKQEEPTEIHPEPF